MAKYDVMIDLETAGNGPGCAIFSIGAVEFDPKGTEVREDKAFYRVINLQSCLDAGLKVDASTIYWWLGQSNPARAALQAGHIDLRPGLYQLSGWIGPLTDVKIWSHGATFDLPILDMAYRAIGQAVPWRYWNCRDTRTILDLADLTIDKAASNVEHNAKTDAIDQAKWVQQAYAKLKEPPRV